MLAVSFLAILLLGSTAVVVDGFSPRSPLDLSTRVRSWELQQPSKEPLWSTDGDASTETTSASGKFDGFNYEEHWYPVGWLEDLPVNKPTKISLFDTDYAVAVKPNNEVLALVDRCPHKSAALSEGRVTETGFLQCAYHGWSFDSDGQCVQVPQASPDASFSGRSCAKSVPARIHQGLVWLWPGPAEKASSVEPPTVPEMDDPAFRTFNKSIRDFPCIDWSLLLSNIMDPDHGVFAHQNPAFDMYSASVDLPLQVEENFENNGWVLTSRVSAEEKILKLDKEKRGKKPKSTPDAITATTVFHAPNHVTICRRNDETGKTQFVAAFWVCPTGTGRSRFLSAAVGKVPFSIPRWITHIGILNFLDQDSVLVASQQPHVLGAEADELDNKTKKSGARRRLFSYQSPSDRAVSLVDNFWDKTLQRAPRRTETLRSLKKAGFLEMTPPRRVVLDREVQHLAICPDSQGTVRNCRRIRQLSIASLAAWTIRTVVRRTVTQWWVPVLSGLIGWAAELVRKQFYFQYTEDKRDKDLQSIPVKMWLDPGK